MKKSILTIVAAVAACAGSVQAQTAPNTTGHRVGVIDMAHVFQNYTKFEALRTNLQAEITQSDEEAKAMVTRLQQFQESLKQYKVGDEKYTAGEKQILAAKGEFDAFRASTQRKLAKSESEMFKVIYTDVTAAVKLYAEYAKFDHVMRYNRKDVSDEMNPQEAVQTMNKTFIYTKSENDITDQVLGYLNKKYGETTGGTNARAASSSGRAPVRQ